MRPGYGCEDRRNEFNRELQEKLKTATINGLIKIPRIQRF